jgi:hypothetical protein
MQKIIVLFFKVLRLSYGKFLKPIDWIMSYFIFYANVVEFSNFKNHSDNFSDCLLRLPLYFELTESEQDAIINSCNSYKIN